MILKRDNNMKKLLALVLGIVLLSSCQHFTRQVGAKITIRLEKGQRLTLVTWKESSLWYLTEKMDSDYKPKTKVFQESSLLGVLEGKVIFIESK